MPNGFGYRLYASQRQRSRFYSPQGWPRVHLGAWICTVVSMAGHLAAAPADRLAAEAVTRGWLAEERPHLATRLHTRIKSVEQFPNFHVVHLEPEGFVVTAADDDFEPVLAFSDKGDFKYDPENPLCIMLNRDVPARRDHLRNMKTKLASGLAAKSASATSPNTEEEEPAITAARRAKGKWDYYRDSAARPAPPTFANFAAPDLNQVLLPASNSVSFNLSTGTGIHVQEITIVDGHVQLTHDSPGSVTVYASYDAGQTWLVQDSGIIERTWTAKQPVSESSCWYKIMPDQVVDELTVNLMRNPPPLNETPILMTNVNVSEPSYDAGLVGSRGSVSDIRVAPLVQSSWNQSSAQGMPCYNYYTPNNYLDGCVATALGQLMRYWQYPTAGIGQQTRTVYVNSVGRSATTRGGNGSGGPYNWFAMPLNPASTTYNSSQWQMIGSLCYDAGVSVNMQYSASGSGAYMYLCASALTSVFQYSNAKYINSPGNILTPTDSNLAAGCPVLFGISSSGRNGHAIVCDGFGYDSGTLYHHINFGWDGAYNYWYALPLLETPYGFNSVDTIIYNVFPSGSGELITGRATTSLGAPVSGAAIVATASGQTYSATTDAKGYYGIKVPSARTYSLTASKAGMNVATRSGVAVGTSGGSTCANLIGIDFTLNNSFSITAVGLTNSVWLRWSAPTNCGLPNNTVYVRHRTDHYPTSASDGDLVYSGSAQAFEHTNVDSSGSVTNYYTIWGDNGSSYASLGNNVNASSLADPGTVRVLWTRSTGEVLTWNLRANGTRKSAGYANVAGGLINMSYWKVIGFNDIDRDGAPDVLWTGTGGEVVFWLLNIDGTLKTTGRVKSGNATASGYWSAVGFSDINRDGTADILWNGAGGELVYWLLNANGTMNTAGRVYPGNATASGYWKVAGFSDINDDGTADILWTGSGGEVVYWLLNADGTRNTAGRVAPGNATASGYWRVIGFNDINGDNTADVLWTGAGGDLVYWLLNANGTQRSAGRVQTGNVTRSGYWSVSGFQDINRDGSADIIWRGQGGETKYWLLNSDGTFRSGGNIDATIVSPSVWTVRAAGRVGGD